MLVRLAWANVWQRKTRACLSILAVGLGVGMMVTMLSLSHGTLAEVARRMSSVDAELMVLPAQDNLIFTGGAAFSDKYRKLIEQVRVDGRPVAKKVIPVLWDTIYMAGQQQRLFGIDPADMPAFLGSRRLLRGRLPDENGRFRAILRQLRGADGRYDPERLSDEQLEAGCELLIDARLAKAGSYKVGDEVLALGRNWRIVGIVEPGVAARVFCPIQTLRHIKLAGAKWSSMFFVKLHDGVDPNAAAEAIGKVTRARVELSSAAYRLLFESFRQVYAYINIASAVALLVCFLLIMVTMYTMIVERSRQIAILKSMGAGPWLLMGQSLFEASILSILGTVLGILLAFGAKVVIEHAMPLLTVEITQRWLLLAMLVGVLGGLASAIYPGWRAGRVEPAAVLQNE